MRAKKIVIIILMIMTCIAKSLACPCQHTSCTTKVVEQADDDEIKRAATGQPVSATFEVSCSAKVKCSNCPVKDKKTAEHTDVVNATVVEDKTVNSNCGHPKATLGGVTAECKETAKLTLKARTN